MINSEISSIPRPAARTGLSTVILLALAANAGAQDSFWDAIREGTFKLDAHYRFEYADQDSRPDTGYASTLRTVISYETAKLEDFWGGIEFENVTVIGNELYDSTVNGMTNRGVVADPEITEVNQAYIAYDGLESLAFKLGRQDVAFANHRFVGNVAWRQNYQSMDAIRAKALWSSYPPATCLPPSLPSTTPSSSLEAGAMDTTRRTDCSPTPGRWTSVRTAGNPGRAASPMDSATPR